MGTKTDPGPFDCYAAAKPDEPMFVLLARDRRAQALVYLWSAMTRVTQGDIAKADEADRTALAMFEWRQAHVPDAAADHCGLATLTDALVMLANQCGAVVTIELESQQPPRMGNYGYRVNIWPKRVPT